MKPTAISIVLLSAFIACNCSTEPEYPAAPAAGMIVVYNNSQTTFHVLRFRQANTLDWGRDYLGSSRVIGPYDDLRYAMPVGTYDFLLENITSEIYVEYKRKTIIAGRETIITYPK